MPTFSIDPVERAEEERCVADVKQYGLHVLKVEAEIDSPAFAYTVGFHHTFEHPEVIIFGLSLDTMHVLLNDLAKRIREGQRFAPNDVSGEFLENYDVIFRAVPARHYRPYLGWANWFNDGLEYQALQMIYPDRDRHWPWEAGVSNAFRQNQPVLETEPVPMWGRDAL
jgi:hypothetical protein